MDGRAVSPRQRAGSLSRNGYATERSKQLSSARLLCRGSELLHMSRAFAAWAAATRERKLRGHMNRCSTMLKHSSLRQDYIRFFLRWLAFAQSRVSMSYRCAIQVRQDVPLRTKADFVALARRYFMKWRTHLREKKQRTSANVNLLVALNRERLRSRALLKWMRFSHARATARRNLESREHEDTIRKLQAEVRKAVHEAEGLRDQLTAALQTQTRLQEELDASRDDFDGAQRRRQTEISDLRESMRAAIALIEGSSSPSLRSLRKWEAASPVRKSNPPFNVSESSHTPQRRSASPDAVPPLAATIADSPASSAQHSKETQVALVRCVENAIAALADLSRPAVVPASLEEDIDGLRRQLQEDAAEFAQVKAQRDELVAAAKAARLTFAAVVPSVSANLANSVMESELDLSRGASMSSAKRASHRLDRSAVSVSLHSGTRRPGAAAAIINGSLPAVFLPSGTSTPSISLPPSPRDGALTDGQELPHLLAADAKSVANTIQALRKSERDAKNEVTDLQDAALRAIDALGGSSVVSAELTAAPVETAEARAQRSSAIAAGLRNLCEDMIVVLVLTSLWSGQRASERVSEALERLWHRTQDLEATHAGYLQQLDDLERVVHTCARLLRQPPASTSAAPTPRNVTPRKAAGALARRRHSAPRDDGPPSAEELDGARRCAEKLAGKGDARPVELLKLCEEAPMKAAAQTTMQTGELEALLLSAQDVLAATIGLEKDPAQRPETTSSARGRDPADESTGSSVSLNAPDMVTALKAGARKVARVLARVDGGTDAPLLADFQSVLEKLDQAKKACADAEKQLSAAKAQTAALDSQRSRDASKYEAAEQKLRQQLEALSEQLKQNEAIRKQLEAHLRDGESQARAAERVHKKEVDDLAKEHKAAEKELQQQLKAQERELDRQAQEKRRDEKMLQKAQEALEQEKAAHARTQQALDAQLKASMTDSESSNLALAKLHAELEALQEECHQAAEDKKLLSGDLEQERAAREQVLRASEEQRETAEAERQLHTEETEALKEERHAAVEENVKLTAAIEELEKKLHSAEAQQTSSGAKERELQEKLDDLKKPQAANEAAKRALEEQLLSVAGENRVNCAVGVFLRDILRDCLTRLHHLTRSVGDAGPMSPRESLTLRQNGDAPPPLLTHDSDPSDYVEYILRLDGNDSTGKRLVQEHLRENCAVRGAKPPGLVVGEEESVSAGQATPSVDAADPSTWEVVAELHDRLVVLYERMAHLDQTAAEQLAKSKTLTDERDQLRADALTSLQQMQPWSSAAFSAAHNTAKHPSRSSSPRSPATSPKKAQEGVAQPTIAITPDVAGPALRTSSTELAHALEALQQVADTVRPLVQLRSPKEPSRRTSTTAGARDADVALDEVAATERLQALVADVQNMASCLQHLSESVHHGIIALGGATGEEEEEAEALHSAPSGSPNCANRTLPGQNFTGGVSAAPGKEGRKVDGHSLAARLEAICEETGTSILEAKHILLGGDGKPSAAAESNASQSPANPLKLRDVIPQIRAKMKELEEVKKESTRLLNGLNRAFDDDEESLFAASMSSTHSRSLKPKKKPLPAFQGTPEAGLRLLQQEIKGKKGRRTGPPLDSATLMSSFGANIRERLGDLQYLRLVCRNTLQVLEGKPNSEGNGQPPTYGEALVTLLTTQVEDLKRALVESDTVLKDYRRNLQNVTVGTRLHLLADVVSSLRLERDSLKEDINRRGRQSNMLLDQLNREVKELRAELQSHEQKSAQLSTAKDGVSEELEVQKRNAGELAARLAQLQHESNVLSTALARTLRGLPASAFYEKEDAAVEKSVQTVLKANQGDALAAAVEEALSAAAGHQHLVRDTFHAGIAELRKDLQELRRGVSQTWTVYGQSMADAAAQAVAETAEVLTLENNMLRPRAVERETLKREVGRLAAALADAAEARDVADARLGHLDDENGRLRRAVRDAEMARALRNADDDATAALALAGRQDSHAVDWERRMIAGATDLAMDAIDSISGRSMSAMFGAVSEETLRIYKGVRETLRGVERACAAAQGTDGRLLWIEVEEGLEELEALAGSADFLWTRLPVLYRVSSSFS